jgi:lysophospholipase L1-like esterase
MTSIDWQRATVLFVGDSVTDAGRTSSPAKRPFDELGVGYVRFVAQHLGSQRAEMGLHIVNRGVSGDRTRELEPRWERDVIAERPDVLSVLIGVNDSWRGFDDNDPTTADEFATRYRALLVRARTAMPALHLVLCEPFLLFEQPGEEGFRRDLDDKVAVVHRLADEFDATLVPFDAMFVAACERMPAEHWADDGIHPTPAGHGLMAWEWMRRTGLTG